MALNPKIATCVAVNEAIRALDFEPHGGDMNDTDHLLDAARDFLLEARARLTETPWPALRRPHLDAESFEQWHATKAAEQRKAGLL
jgi:hypothetical protein